MQEQITNKITKFNWDAIIHLPYISPINKWSDKVLTTLCSNHLHIASENSQLSQCNCLKLWFYGNLHRWINLRRYTFTNAKLTTCLLKKEMQKHTVLFLLVAFFQNRPLQLMKKGLDSVDSCPSYCHNVFKITSYLYRRKNCRVNMSTGIFLLGTRDH